MNARVCGIGRALSDDDAGIANYLAGLHAHYAKTDGKSAATMVLAHVTFETYDAMRIKLGHVEQSLDCVADRLGCVRGAVVEVADALASRECGIPALVERVAEVAGSLSLLEVGQNDLIAGLEMLATDGGGK